MNAEEMSKDKILFRRSILNGFFAWIFGFVIFMIPAFIMAVKMGFELGPKMQDSAAVSKQISETIAGTYRSNPYLIACYFLVIALIIFWRARRIAMDSGKKGVINGLLVGAVPAVLSFLFTSEFAISSFVGVILFLGAGALGGRRKQ